MKKAKTAKKKLNTSTKIVVGIICAVLVIYSISIILPLVWGFMTSLKNEFEYHTLGNILGFPSIAESSKELLFGNYLTIFENLAFTCKVNYYSMGVAVSKTVEVGILNLLLNTLLLAGAGAALTTIVPCIVSYMAAKYKYKFSKVIYWFVVITMTIPAIGIYPSELAMLRAMGLYDTFIGYLLQKSHFLGMYFLVYFAFFESFPDSYMEAAEIDGASHFRVMVTIALPLAGKIISSVFLLQFVTFWNDYQTINLYMPTHPTLAWGFWQLTFNLTNIKFNNTPTKVAGTMILAIPISIIYVIFRDKLMGNLSMGGLKG